MRDKPDQNIVEDDHLPAFAAEIMPPASATPNWQQIERAYRTGLLPVSAIARMHGVRTAEVKDRASKKGWRLDLAQDVRQEVVRRLAVSMVADADEEAPHDIVERIAALMVDIQSRQRRAALELLKDWEASHAAYRRIRDNRPQEGDVLWMGKGWSLATWEAHLVEQRQQVQAMIERAFTLPVGGTEELPLAGRGAIAAGAAPEINIYIPSNGRDAKVIEGEDP